MAGVVLEEEFGQSVVGFMNSEEPVEVVNEGLAFEVIQTCWGAGCREFVVCSGSRNSPLVLVLLSLQQKYAELKIWNFFEERSAAFFALGRSKISGIPTAVVTTSGTAVAELLPAVVEAHYADVSLILVTADRPDQFRYSGAPQTIDQVRLLKPYAEIFVDVCANDSSALEGLLPSGEVHCRWHINVCFDEPLVSGHDRKGMELCETPALGIPDVTVAGEELDLVKTFIADRRGLVVLSGGLPPGEQNQDLLKWLKQLACPIWAEASSGLRENDLLSDLIIRSGEKYFSKNKPSKILRIGDVPSLRFWRDLESLDGIEVLSIDPPGGYPGLGRSAAVANSKIFAVIEALPLKKLKGNIDLLDDRESWNDLLALLKKYPLSEPAWLCRLSLRIPAGSLVFLGNSMPIREWNLAASYEDRQLRCFASRGANGIDGQLSSFLGLSVNEDESWGLFGDLTTLYDMSAPWVMDQMKSGKRRYVVINNGGGRIFSHLPYLANLAEDEKRVTENRHQMNFQHWAAMWGLGYQQVEEVDEFVPGDIAKQESLVIELCPDLDQTEAFWRNLNGDV